jgi:hypothetical protein
LHPALDPGGEARGAPDLTSVIASRHVPHAFPVGRPRTLACYPRSGSGILAIPRIERHQIIIPNESWCLPTFNTCAPRRRHHDATMERGPQSRKCRLSDRCITARCLI